jgi:hypothetical protein
MSIQIYPTVRLLLRLCLLVLLVPASALAESSCGQGQDARIWTSPLVPKPGEPLGIMAVSTEGYVSELIVIDPAGRRTTLPVATGGGPPWSVRGTLPAAIRGSYRIEALRSGRVVGCGELQVGGGSGNRGSGEWDQATQALFAAWVEHLFDAPPEQALSFPSLEPVLRDPQRNFLYDYLRKGEDLRVAAEPDCADLSFFLRTYFAWKLGLPVSWRACDRGSSNRPPHCDQPEVDRSFIGTAASVDTFHRVSRRVMDQVTSGGGRTALADDGSDFYPVALERASLWPGTVYADPYGHTLMIVKWVPQSGEHGGLLLAVDAQPDNSVARKRFWEGTFLFAKTPSAGPGFKAYRPPLAGGAKGGLTPPVNRTLTGRAGLPPYSTEQEKLGADDFYARMERLINPRGLDPEAAYEATLAALMEQLETRVKSVDNGEEYMRGHRGTMVAMPKGPAIFETVGPWEDFATPSRDMRLLIALKVLENFPARIRNHPELYVFKQLLGLKLESATAAAERIEKLHAQSIREKFITYTRSDGTPFRLSLADIYARRPGLEIAYNPNDCVERRWGAAPGLPDYGSCRRQAPPEQRTRMEEYRPWFREAKRPPR